MTVKELCSNYDLKFQTVYKKITHHKDKELAGHITKVKGESLELDDFAVDFLLPTHVKVMQAIEECEGIARENAELQNKLESAAADAEQANEQLSKSLADNENLLADDGSYKVVENETWTSYVSKDFCKKFKKNLAYSSASKK